MPGARAGRRLCDAAGTRRRRDASSLLAQLVEVLRAFGPYDLFPLHSSGE